MRKEFMTISALSQ